MAIHYGRLDGNTREGKVYRFLKARRGEWCSTMEVTIATKVLSMSTAVSGVRSQLPPRERIEMKRVRHEDGGLVWYYRWTRAEASPAPVDSEGQFALFDNAAA